MYYNKHVIKRGPQAGEAAGPEEMGMEYYKFYGTNLYKAVEERIPDLFSVRNYLGDKEVRAIFADYMNEDGEIKTDDFFDFVFANRDEAQRFEVIVYNIETSLRQRVAKKWMDSMSQEQAQMIRDLIGSGNKINFNGFTFDAKEIPGLWGKAHEKNECI